MYCGDRYDSVSNLLSLALFPGWYLPDPIGIDSFPDGDSKRGMTNRVLSGAGWLVRPVTNPPQRVQRFRGVPRTDVTNATQIRAFCDRVATEPT
jgi:hypothetical protein